MLSKYFVSLNAKRGKNAKLVRIKVQSEEKIGWSCRGGHAAESSLTWWCYLLRVIYARLKRWWITRALPRLCFVSGLVSVSDGQPHTFKVEDINVCMQIHTRAAMAICVSCTVCACNSLFSFEYTVFARQCVPFSTRVCLHVCTKEDWRLTGSQGKAWNLWPEYIFSHISDEWGSPSETWQGLFSSLFTGNKYSPPWS